MIIRRWWLIPRLTSSAFLCRKRSCMCVLSVCVYMFVHICMSLCVSVHEVVQLLRWAASVTVWRQRCIFWWDKFFSKRSSHYSSTACRSLPLRRSSDVHGRGVRACVFSAVYVRPPAGRWPVCLRPCVCPGLRLGSVTRTAAQTVKLFGLNFSNWSISEGLRQAESNWS